MFGTNEAPDEKKIDLTQEHFNFFKERVLFYLKEFKLDGYWQIKITQTKKRKGALGGYCESEFWNGCAEIGLITENYPAMKDNLLEDIDETARHEVCHLIGAKICSLARNRYVQVREIDDADEELNRKICDLLDPKKKF